MQVLSRFHFVTNAVILCVVAFSAPLRAEDSPVFSRDIQPLLSKHCLLCHGPDESEAGLRLDLPDEAYAERDSGLHAIVPGKPIESELLRRVTSTDEAERMPPEGDPLSQQEVDLLRRWIAEGARFEEHWAWRPVAAVNPPDVEDESWPRNPIDRFVLSKLEERQIAPSPEADRATLIKRLSYDFIGLPPTPAEVDVFLADESSAAYETLVDRLLASDHFGERWGRHWLDKARYADSDGYEKDNPRPNAWRYRDWVIDAINEDVPYDEFTIQQLAGDLLPDASPLQKLATAFHRQTLTNTEGGTDKEEFRVEATFDRTETTGAVWMGLTLTCARCHNHKYDQISQREYYQLFAFFNDADESTMELVRDEEEMQKYVQDKEVWDAELAKATDAFNTVAAELKLQLDTRTEELAQQVAAESDGPPDIPKELVKPLRKPATDRNPAEQIAIQEYVATLLPESKNVATKLAELKKNEPQKPVLSVRVIAPAGRTTTVLHRGDFLQPADEVTASALEIMNRLHPLAAREPDGEADRLDLARWLVDPHHPLTARVTVNQVWAQLFGQGIVASVNDFGVRGEQPTHPELLDWLAWEFPRSMHWSRKQLIKTIVMSATWRQSSEHRPELYAVDPTNRLVARQNRLRVEAEIVRDLNLAVGGLLSQKIGGPSVFPPLPPGVAELSYANNFKWQTSEGDEAYRRGMYTFFKRTAPHPTLVSFDCPDSNTTRLQREASNTPLQALVTLNNEVFSEAAQALARRVLTEGGSDDRQRLTYALRLCIVRSPETMEVDQFTSLLDAARVHYQVHPDDAKLVIQRHAATNVSAEENAAWVATVRIILNLDEFIVRD